MRVLLNFKSHGSARGFTLIEIILASTIFAILIAALYTVYYGSMRLRETSFEKVEAGLPTDYAASVFQRDLSAAVPAAGVLAGTFSGTSATNDSLRNDRIEFYCASGSLASDRPWGDVQKVAYYLADPSETETRRAGSSDLEKRKDLVRVVKRNLLASTTEEPPAQYLLKDVESFEVNYYDGQNWVESWDSSAQDRKLPSAVRVMITFPETDGASSESKAKRPPVEIFCECSAQPRQVQRAIAVAGGGGL